MDKEERLERLEAFNQLIGRPGCKTLAESMREYRAMQKKVIAEDGHCGPFSSWKAWRAAVLKGRRD